MVSGNFNRSLLCAQWIAKDLSFHYMGSGGFNKSLLCAQWIAKDRPKLSLYGQLRL